MPVKDKQAKLAIDRRYRENNREKTRESTRKWVEANKDRVKENGKRYYKENKGKIAIRTKMWREKNKERLNKRGLEYYYENKERLLEKKKEYTKKNREVLRQKCRERHHTLPNKYGQYRDNAKVRGYEFNLTKEEFAEYWMKPCSYCGSEIKTIGLDRMDPKLGYSLDNIVTCCRVCNMMKNKMGYKDFLDKCSVIANRNRVG